MHLVIMIAAGLFLLLAMGFLGLLFGGGRGVAWAAETFLVLWAGASLANMWFAVTRMDSTWGVERRQLAWIFGLPAATALFVWWKYSG